MHLLNTVCSQLFPQSGTVRSPQPPLTVSVLDEKFSSLFNDSVTSEIPAQAFELLFGAHRYDFNSE